MRYKWLSQEQIIELVNPVLKSKGYAELGFNGQCECGRTLPTARVLGAFLDTGELIESFTLAMVPMLGPLLKHNTDIRDSGETSRQTATIMYDFLMGAKARDFIVIANSPISRRLCERFQMKQVEVPVFMTKPGNSETP
jgi:hypothetical protein